METKFIVAEKSETVDVERSVVGWGSKPLPDRDGELIEASAWDLENFRKNPVLCLSHDLSKPPIGKILWVKSDANGLKFKAQFAGTERGKEAYQLYKEGVMTSFSVGFRPKPGGYVENPMEDKYKGLKKVFKSVELFEISCVTVPSLPSAVAEYVKSGKIQNAELKGELEDLVTKDIIEGAEAIAEVLDENKDANVELKGKEETDEGKVKDPTDEKEKVAQPEAPTLESMAAELAEMKTKLAEIESRKERRQEEKMLDFGTGQPSVYDIMSSLNSALSNKETALPTVVSDDRVAEYRPYASVVDIYPITYPDGIVVFRIYSGNAPSVTYRQGYVFDPVTKKATLNDDATVVEEAWVEKKYDLDMMDSVGKEMTENEDVKPPIFKSVIEDAMDALTGTVEYLQELLDKAYEAKEDKSVDDDEIEFEGFDEDEKIVNKGADSHVADDEIQLEDENIDDIDIDAKELSDIITKTMGSALGELSSQVKDKAVEEANKLMGKATI